jgi:hypothetical protein
LAYYKVKFTLNLLSPILSLYHVLFWFKLFRHTNYRRFITGSVQLSSAQLLQTKRCTQLSPCVLVLKSIAVWKQLSRGLTLNKTGISCEDQLLSERTELYGVRYTVVNHIRYLTVYRMQWTVWIYQFFPNCLYRPQSNRKSSVRSTEGKCYLICDWPCWNELRNIPGEPQGVALCFVERYEDLRWKWTWK